MPLSDVRVTRGALRLDFPAPRRPIAAKRRILSTTAFGALKKRHRLSPLCWACIVAVAPRHDPVSGSFKSRRRSHRRTDSRLEWSPSRAVAASNLHKSMDGRPACISTLIDVFVLFGLTTYLTLFVVDISGRHIRIGPINCVGSEKINCQTIETIRNQEC